MTAATDQALIDRAKALIQRGNTVEQAAQQVGVNRTTLYRAGVRSSR